jgi:hypothetical protein
LHRGPIKLFYSKVQYAIDDGYTDYKPNCYQIKIGFLYSFTGLRGDARRMYKSIKSGEEKRV